MKRLPGLTQTILCLLALLVAIDCSSPAQSTQQLAFSGLRSVAGKGQFNSVQTDSVGNLYLLLDQKDGVRILKMDPGATQVYAQAHLGSTGDIGIAMALDPSGNVYITGTTTSGTISGTSGVAFPTRADSTTNSFVAKFDSALNPIFVTYAGSGRMAATGIAATGDAVFITGSIFAATLPVTSSAIIQSPASGSSGNGFVERFNASGTALVYATYLSGFGGDTAPAAIAADSNDNACIAGYTTASGYPTVSAVVPTIIGNTSGFLTKLSPAGDGIAFSTFIPGNGITSLAIDTTTQNLVLSGSVSLGGFPVDNVIAPLVAAGYQVAVRMPLDGSSVLSSTLLAPGAQSVISPAANGTAWAAVPLSTPLLPLSAISSIGNTAAFRITAQGIINQSLRMGGVGPSFTLTVPVSISSITADSSGQPTFAGNAAPTTSASLLATKTFDLPLFNTPTNALPSTLRDAMLPVGTNCGSLCAGSGAYLSKLLLTPGPTLALSTDSAPNITLRNLGSQQATNLQLSATAFTLVHNCPNQFGAGSECNIVLQGNGPGTITAQAANATTQTIAIPSLTRTADTIVFSPSEIDFGIVTDSTTTRTVTVTNLGSTAQPVPFFPFTSPGTSANPFTLTTDCPTPTLPTAIQPGASCHLFFAASLPSSLSSGLSTSASWTARTSTITATAYLDPNPLNLSAAAIDFGTQYSTPGSLRLPRYLYLSNNSSSSIQHSHVAQPSSSVFTVADHCPSVLEPHTICQLQIDYFSPLTSADSVTLALDQGLSVLVSGRTMPQPGAGGTSANPSLTVTPTSLDFSNSVIVTTTSSSSQTATISNAGTAPFPLSLTLTGDFLQSTNCPAVLAGGTSCSVVITFAPSQPGTRQGLLNVSSGSGTTPAYVNLSGTGTAVLASNNGTLDLGSTTIGQPVVQWTKITQPFSQLTVTTTSGDFGVVLVEDIGYGHGQPPYSSFTPTATGSCTNCWLGVQFLPTASGPTGASLSLASSSSGNSYTLSLTGNGLPLTGLLLTPTQQDFGPVSVHSSSAPVLFTLTNLTPTTATLSSPILTGDFSLSSAPTGGATCNGPLAVNASCFLQVVYSPTATGPASGTLSISSGTETASATLAAYGSADTGLSLNPSALVFRNVPGSTSTVQSITVSNTSIYNLQIATPISSSASFTSTNTCGTLTPGATCTITITFVPSDATATGALTIPVISSTAGNPTTAYTVALTGAYTSEDAGLQIIPGQAVYGPTSTSTLGLTRQFTINNLTTKSLTLTLALSMPRQFVLTQAPCAALAPNASCNFSVAFLPLTNGDITGTLFAEATPTDSSATLNSLGYVEGFGIGSGSLSIAGPLLPGELLAFGQIASGQTATRTLTLSNSGSSPLTVRRITSEWPFLATTTCGTKLAPSENCTVSLTYSPLNQAVAGSSPAPFSSDTGTLVIESDAASSPDFIDLSGTVTPVTVNAPSNTAPLVSYTVSDSSLTFPSTSGGNASAPRTVTLSNTGTATIHIASLATTPDFTVSGSCVTIVPGASCPIAVTFTPQASSSQTISTVVSALEIGSDAGTPLNFISLLGTATPSTLVLAPVALDFGAVLVGASATLPIQVTNGSPNPATFAGISATGDYTVSSNCPASGSQLAPGASCTMQVTFTPTLAGTRTGTVSVATSLTSLPLNVNLSGSGAQSHLQAIPTDLNFDSVIVGNSTRLTFSLANTGTAPVSRIALAVTGDYAIAIPCSSTTLAPGASCAVSIAFTPTATGTRTGSLTIASSEPSSPLAVPLTGTGLAPGAFALTVNGGVSSSVTVISGRPGTYNLSITPQNGYTGTVVLNCTPVNPGQYATCSLLPSSLTLNNSAPQSSAATLNTVTSVATASQSRPGQPSSSIALCLLPFSLVMFRRTRVTLAIALLTVSLLFTSGCGSGGTLTAADPNLRYTPPGTYQYQVTATSTTGAQLSQTVTLNLTVTAR